MGGWEGKNNLHFMLFPTFKKNHKLGGGYCKVPLHLLVKWEVVSPNSR